VRVFRHQKPNVARMSSGTAPEAHRPVAELQMLFSHSEPVVLETCGREALLAEPVDDDELLVPAGSALQWAVVHAGASLVQFDPDADAV